MRDLKLKADEIKELDRLVKVLKQENESASNLKKLRNSIHQQRKDEMEAELARLERENEALKEEVSSLKQAKEALFEEVEALWNDKKPTGVKGSAARVIKLEN